jgi:hypothetical protein
MHNLFASLFADAGLPPGCLQILNFSNEDVAARVEQMIAHPDVRVCRNLKLLADPVVGEFYRLGQAWSDTGYDVC